MTWVRGLGGRVAFSAVSFRLPTCACATLARPPGRAGAGRPGSPRRGRGTLQAPGNPHHEPIECLSLVAMAPDPRTALSTREARIRSIPRLRLPRPARHMRDGPRNEHGAGRILPLGPSPPSRRDQRTLTPRADLGLQQMDRRTEGRSSLPGTGMELEADWQTSHPGAVMRNRDEPAHRGSAAGGG